MNSSQLEYTKEMSPHNPTCSSGEQAGDRFRALFQELPPELKGMIHRWTFSSSATVQQIHYGYRLPSLLRVDRESRHMFAQTYFPRTTFKATNQATLRTWLCSLDAAHREMISDVHLDISSQREASSLVKPQKSISWNGQTLKWKARREAGPEISDYARMMNAEARLYFAHSFLARERIGLGKHSLKVNVQFEGMGKAVWTSEPGYLFERCKEGWEAEWRKFECRDSSGGL